MSKGWGGRREGAGGEPKPLIHHVLRGSFRADRHERLLAECDSLLRFKIEEEDPGLLALLKLAEIQIAYREAETQRQRYTALYIFQLLVGENFGPKKARRVARALGEPEARTRPPTCVVR